MKHGSVYSNRFRTLAIEGIWPLRNRRAELVSASDSNHANCTPGSAPRAGPVWSWRLRANMNVKNWDKLIVVLIASCLLGTFAWLALHRTPVPPPERLKQWSDSLLLVSKDRDFIYDCYWRQLSLKEPNAAARESMQAMLEEIEGYKLICAVHQDGANVGTVFVTDSNIGRTRGYLVCAGDEIPWRHRSGAFNLLKRLDTHTADSRVFYFESP